MKGIERYKLEYHSSLKISRKPLYLFIKGEDGNYVKYRNYKRLADRNVVLTNKIDQLQARIKELESQSHINEIKAQGIEEAIKKADNETYIGIVGQEFPPQSQYKAELLCYAEQLRTKHD